MENCNDMYTIEQCEFAKLSRRRCSGGRIQGERLWNLLYTELILLFVRFLFLKMLPVPFLHCASYPLIVDIIASECERMRTHFT